jgi:hypothetical protein|tara:strand:- start:396 stop:590 length:195 start_codon:yes stop_codon:yes gene_type:complete
MIFKSIRIKNLKIVFKTTHTPMKSVPYIKKYVPKPYIKKDNNNNHEEQCYYDEYIQRIIRNGGL